jgi:hypothetical protein
MGWKIESVKRGGSGGVLAGGEEGRRKPDLEVPVGFVMQTKGRRKVVVVTTAVGDWVRDGELLRGWDTMLLRRRRLLRLSHSPALSGSTQLLARRQVEHDWPAQPLRVSSLGHGTTFALLTFGRRLGGGAGLALSSSWILATAGHGGGQAWPCRRRPGSW